MSELGVNILRKELKEFIVKACGADDHNVSAICNGLRRGYYVYDTESNRWNEFHITSIDDLNEASIDDIRKIRYLGGKRLAIVEEAKRLIKEFLEGDA